MFPPPPLRCWSARLVYRARRLTSVFGFRPRSNIEVSRGFFSGPTQPCPMQHHCRVAPRTRLVSCGFAVEASAGQCIGQHRACPMHVP